MDIDDNDAQDHNLHIVGEGSSKISPVLHSYSLPKFEFDDSLHGHLRFDNLVDNEAFLEITSQEDNHWIEEYSTAVKSTRKNVWSEATSSESVEMLLKSVGQEEKVLEESNRHSNLTSVMDPKGALESIVLGDKYNSSVGDEAIVGDEVIDKIYDDANQEASKIETESFVIELQEDSSVSKVDCGNAGSSQNIETASGMSKDSCDNDPDYITKGKENSMDTSTNSGTIVETRTFSVKKLSVVLNVESVDKPLVEGSVSVSEETENGVGSVVQHVTSGTSMVSPGNNQFEISEGIKTNNVGKTLQGCSSADISTENILNKDETVGNMDKNVAGAADSQKNVEVIEIAQDESNMDVLTDAVVAVELSKKSSPDTPDGVQLPSGTVATSDVTEDTPRSPILGVSLLSNDNKEKVEAEFTTEGPFQRAPEVVKDTVSDDDKKFVHFNAGRSEKTVDDDSGSLLDPKATLAGEDEAEPLNLAVNPDLQQLSVDVAGSSGCDTNHSSLDKPQPCSLSDAKSIELSPNAKDKHDITKGSMHENATLSSSATKEEKSLTSEVNASTSQNLNLSKNMVSSISFPGSQVDVDPIKPHEDSPVSQPLRSTATEAVSKGTSERKPRKKSVGTDTKQSNNMKEKTSTRRSRKVEKMAPLPTPPATGHVAPVGNPKPGDMTPISTSSNLPILNNSTPGFHNSFTDNQQVQLRAQILVYGSVLSGIPPEEPHMIAAFGQSDGGRKAWETTWHTYLERFRGHKAQPNNPGSSTPNQGIKLGSAQSKIPSSISSPIVNPVIPVSSPLWNIPTPSDGSQPNAMRKTNPFDPYQTPGVQNFAGHNPMWLSQGPFPGQWVASSPVASFNARLSALPITESVKLTTVKEFGAPSIPVISVGPSASPIISPMVSSGKTSSDSKSRKRKKVVSSQVTTSAALSTPASISSKSNPGDFVSAITLASAHGQSSYVDKNIEKIVTKENIVSKIEESKVQAADAAVLAAAAVNHCQNVWSQLESQKNAGLVSDAEAKLASSAVSIAAASSVAKVAAAAAKIASNVAEQARLMADEVLISSRTENYDQSTTSSVISAAKEAARRRIEAASAASKHAENLDAIVKAAELAAEAVSQAGKIVAIGNPLSLRELIEAGPEGYWKSPQSSSQQGHSDKQNVETALIDKENSGGLVKNQMIIASHGNDKSAARGRNGSNLSKTVGVITKSEFGSVHTSDFDQNMPQSTFGTWNENIIKEGCLVEVCKDRDQKKSAWFAANVLTLKDGKAFVCYTELLSDDGKLTEWVPLDVEGTEPPRIRIAHPMTTMRSEGTRKRGRTTFTDYNWCSGDRVDVWVQDCWCEAVVVEISKIDSTSLVVQFPDQRETSAVRSWHVRPTLIWKDGKWIECSSLKGSHSSEGDTPHEKRHKIGSPVVEGKDKAQLSHIPLSSQGISFDLGQSARNVNKSDSLRATKTGLPKKQSRVVFGVPKPGKKQKFINVSTHRVDDRNNKNSTPNDTPQVSGDRGSENHSKTYAKEKQVAEVKPKAIKSRKPPIPSFKTLTQKDKSKPSKPAPSKPAPSKPASHDPIMSDETLSDQPNRTEFDSSNIEDAKETSTSKAVGNTAAADQKATNVGVEAKSTSETEPRRSVRRIQPTSRLLEGLQSSLTISHASQRSHNKITSKGSTDPS